MSVRRSTSRAERIGARCAPDLSPSVLGKSVLTLRGVGPQRGRQLQRLGVVTVGDLLRHVPRRYQDRRTLTPTASLRAGEVATVVVEIVAVRQRRPHPGPGGRGRRFERTMEATGIDASGAVTLVWFHQPAGAAPRCSRGQRLLVYGHVDPGPKFVHPDIEVLAGVRGGEDARPGAGTTAFSGNEPRAKEPVERLVPIYLKPSGISQGVMRGIVRTAVRDLSDCLRESVPEEIVERNGFMDPAAAVRYVHAPPRDADLEALEGARSSAHRTLIFEELFYVALGLGIRRHARARTRGIAFAVPGDRARRLLQNLPFSLTGAQARVLNEVFADMATPRPMRRLIQGDVGSGKTIIALLASLVVLDAGRSAAVMAPTEVLAEQHYETFRHLLQPLEIELLLLTGRLGTRARLATHEVMASGRPVLVVGTHALLQEGASLPRLGLAVVDEQHRFGVLQRRALGNRGRAAPDEDGSPDCMVMTATPIPRTLAMTLYGDLEVSRIDELPQGRRPAVTRVVADGERERVYAEAREALKHGRQAFVIFPRVEESETGGLRAATTMVSELGATVFAGHGVGLLHGRMSAGEKEDVMRRFRAGAYRALVSTTVIEVGIDVPNAGVMIVEHADRFGLAQLHQLRGRVGRGTDEGSCYLVASRGCSAEAQTRLRLLEQCSDGGQIAEEDLRMRGPGEFLGTRQAGLPPLRVASLLRDHDLLHLAHREALDYLAGDPFLSSAAARAMRVILRQRFTYFFSNGSMSALNPSTLR